MVVGVFHNMKAPFFTRTGFSNCEIGTTVRAKTFIRSTLFSTYIYRTGTWGDCDLVVKREVCLLYLD